MKESYKISDFYLFLKLGIWSSGEVADWGQVKSLIVSKNSKLTDYGFSLTEHITKLEKVPNLKRSMSHYMQQTLAKGLPAIGVYLLDFYLLSKKTDERGVLKTYMAVFSTGKFGLEKKESIHIVRISNYADIFTINTLLNKKEVKKRKRTSYFRKRRPVSMPDFTPVHSVERKY